MDSDMIFFLYGGPRGAGAPNFFLSLRRATEGHGGRPHLNFFLSTEGYTEGHGEHLNFFL